MDLNYLREFLALAEVGNFSKAAAKLHTTQPLLSRHVQKLEQELGCQLFERTTKIVALNENGKQLQPYAQRAVNALDDYFALAESTTDARESTLNIGYSDLFSHSDIHDAISVFLSSRQITPTFIREPASVLRQGLRKGELDIAAIYELERDHGGSSFSRITYARDTLAAVLPPSHPLADQEEIELSQLANETFVLVDSAFPIGELSRKCCASAGFTPKVSYVSKYEDNIIDLVSKNAGITLLLKNPRIISDVSVVDIQPRVAVDLNLLYLKQNSKPELQDFAEYMDGYLAGRV